jgi:hypothetical protein
MPYLLYLTRVKGGNEPIMKQRSLVPMRYGEYVALVGCAVAVAVYAFWQGTEGLGLFANWGLIAYMGTASLVGIGTYLNLGGSKMTNISLGYSLGLLSWLLGLSIYTYAYFVAGTELPYLSIADVFYLLSYPAWVLGAVGMLRVSGRGTRTAGWLAVAAVGVVLYILIIVYVIPASVSGLESPMEAFVTALYPTLDVAFFLLTLAFFVVFRGGIFERAFAFMALGAMLFALGDLLYAVLSVTGLYYDGHPMDLLLFLGCVSAGYAFWRQNAELVKLK